MSIHHTSNINCGHIDICTMHGEKNYTLYIAIFNSQVNVMFQLRSLQIYKTKLESP